MNQTEYCLNSGKKVIWLLSQGIFYIKLDILFTLVLERMSIPSAPVPGLWESYFWKAKWGSPVLGDVTLLFHECFCSRDAFEHILKKVRCLFGLKGKEWMLEVPALCESFTFTVPLLHSVLLKLSLVIMPRPLAPADTGTEHTILGPYSGIFIKW